MSSKKNYMMAAGVSAVVLSLAAGPAAAGGAFIDPLGRSSNVDAGYGNVRGSGAAYKGMGLDPNGRDGGGFIDPNGREGGVFIDPNGRGAAIDPNGRDFGFLGWLLRLFGWH